MNELFRWRAATNKLFQTEHYIFRDDAIQSLLRTIAWYLVEVGCLEIMKVQFEKCCIYIHVF